jgi:hypothetical protein
MFARSFARRTRFGAVPPRILFPEIAFRRHLILPQDNAWLPAPRPIFGKSVPRHRHRPRERRVRTARGCVRTVIGVESPRRADTSGAEWRPPRGTYRSFAVISLYKPRRTGLRPAACTPAGYAADVVFGTSARLVCRPQAHLATSAPRGLCNCNPESAATFAAATVVRRGEGLSLRRRLGRLPAAHDHPDRARRRGQRDLIVVGHAHP